MKKLFILMFLFIGAISLSGCSNLFHKKVTMNELLPYLNRNAFIKSPKTLFADAAICQYDSSLSEKLNTNYTRGTFANGIPFGPTKKYKQFDKYYDNFRYIFTNKGYSKIYKKLVLFCEQATTMASLM